MSGENKCGCWPLAGAMSSTNCRFPELHADFDKALAHLKALILAQAFRSEVSDAASDFVKEHE